MNNRPQNRKIVGVDLFVEAPLVSQFPERVGELALKHVASRGTVLSRSRQAEILDVGWICVRYLFTQAVGSRADEAIAQLVQTIGEKHSWSSLIKLYEVDGTNGFS